MRILLSHNFYRSSSPSGEDKAYLAEKEMLEKAGFDVCVYERHSDEINDYSRFKVAKAALASTWARDSFAEINAVLTKFKPDLAHFHNTFPLISPSAYFACHQQSVPVVQTLHNYRLICPGALLLRNNLPCEDCVGGSLWPALRHACYRDSAAASAAVALMLSYHRWRGTYEHRIDRFIALTYFAAERFVAGGLPADKIVVRPNFLPNNLLPNADHSKQRYAIYVGRLSMEKGIKILVSAWQFIQSVPLKVIGDGPLREELETFATERHLNISFLGSVDRKTVIDHVHRAFLQIIPSICYENFPLAIVEAYACGTPVLGSRIGSLAGLIAVNQTGWLFEPGNEQDLAEKVQQAFEAPDPQLWAKRTRQAFDTHYSEAAALNSLLQIYEQTRHNNH